MCSCLGTDALEDYVRSRPFQPSCHSFAYWPPYMVLKAGISLHLFLVISTDCKYQHIWIRQTKLTASKDNSMGSNSPMTMESYVMALDSLVSPSSPPSGLQPLQSHPGTRTRRQQRIERSEKPMKLLQNLPQPRQQSPHQKQVMGWLGVDWQYLQVPW